MSRAFTPEALARRFTAFYSDLHQTDPETRTPYKWQCRLASDLASGKEFGELITPSGAGTTSPVGETEDSSAEWFLVAPTGAGKTTFIECFLFALAEQLERGGRSLPLRLYWVVDRRAVVDQVFEHARGLVDRLATADAGTAAARVAASLRRAAEGDDDAGQPPLEVRLWRGGTSRGIERVPLAAPCVICSTVDQVGSRLLFRGYGTAPGSRAIDAALVGTDSLIVLDEAHLSQPFADTVGRIRKVQGRAHRQGVRMARLMQVSATPAERTVAMRRFELSPDELTEEPLVQRLQACKRVRLKQVSNVPRGLARAAKDLCEEAQVVGVIANTVADARAVHAELSTGADAVLMIGPSRPLDRSRVLTGIPERGTPERAAREGPLFVVGTQTLEVGVDLDFDALVSACAPFPSLVQRFGRLDRAGEVTKDDEFARGAIIASRTSDPVYGDAVQKTWAWLQSRTEDGELDMGPEAIADHWASDPPGPPPQPRAPILGPWHIEALIQTSRDPMPTPEIGFFLHGEDGARDADVAIAWRSDLTIENLDEWQGRVRARPPHAGELLSLPVVKVKQWLQRRADDLDFSDIESTAEEPRKGAGTAVSAEPVTFGRVNPPGADGEWGVETGVSYSDICSGDVLVVPCSVGGCDEFGWVPGSRAHVSDLGDLNPKRPRVLLGPATALGRLPESLRARVEEVIADLAAEDTNARAAYDTLKAEMRKWLSGVAIGDRGRHDEAGGGDQAAGSTDTNWYPEVREAIDKSLCARGRVIPLPSENPRHLVLEPRTLRRASGPERQPYEKHVERVVELAAAYARSQQLKEEVERTILLAARYHDLGKHDPRFQAWLNRGAAPPAGEVLAKSDVPPNDPRSESYRVAAGWPRRKRHEMTSAVMVKEAVSAGAFNGCDPDLLVHLVAVHHGQLRPFLPMRVRRNQARRGQLVTADDADTSPVTVTATIEGSEVSVGSDQELDFSEHAERFAELNERYGPWGLASLEATLVLADRLASAEVS